MVSSVTQSLPADTAKPEKVSDDLVCALKGNVPSVDSPSRSGLIPTAECSPLDLSVTSTTSVLSFPLSSTACQCLIMMCMSGSASAANTKLLSDNPVKTDIAIAKLRNTAIKRLKPVLVFM